MKLYHFTHYKAARKGPRAIKRAGLRAHGTKRDYPQLAKKLGRCVWFTAEKNPKILFTDGKNKWRVTAELPKSDKLVNWAAWLRKNDPDFLKMLFRMERNGRLGEQLGRKPTKAEARCWRAWWIHFGNVPKAAISSVEYAGDVPFANKTYQEPPEQKLVFIIDGQEFEAIPVGMVTRL